MPAVCVAWLGRISDPPSPFPAVTPGAVGRALCYYSGDDQRENKFSPCFIGAGIARLRLYADGKSAAGGTRDGPPSALPPCNLHTNVFASEDRSALSAGAMGNLMRWGNLVP